MFEKYLFQKGFSGLYFIVKRGTTLKWQEKTFGLRSISMGKTLSKPALLKCFISIILKEILSKQNYVPEYPRSPSDSIGLTELMEAV